MLETISTSVNALIRIVVYLREHPKEQILNIEEFSHRYSDIYNVIAHIADISMKLTPDTIEDQIINAVTPLPISYQSILGVFLARTSESIALAETIRALLNGTESIIKAAHGSKQNKTQKQNRIKQEKPKTKEQNDVSKSINIPIRKNHLMNLLNQESKVVRLRIMLDYHQKIADDLNAQGK